MKRMYDEDEIFKIANPDYKLIETITITESTREIVRTQDPDGNAYDFKDLYVLMQNAISPNGGYLHIGINENLGIVQFDLSYSLSSSAIGHVAADFHKIAPKLFNGNAVASITSGSSASAGGVNRSFLREQTTDSNIYRLYISGQGNGTFESGTVVKVYAR